MSPIRPFRRFCLACLEPDRSVKVVEGGRAATVCACGNSVVRAAVEGETSDPKEGIVKRSALQRRTPLRRNSRRLGQAATDGLCQHGHPYVSMTDKRGWRRCRTCHNERGYRREERIRLEKIARYGTSNMRAIRRMAEPARACHHCGATIPQRSTERPSVAKRRRYCSHRCARAAQHERFLAARIAPGVLCRGCGAPLTKEKPSALIRRRFCSSACWYAFPRDSHRPTFACETCGAITHRYPGPRGRRQRFCSQRCSGIKKRGSASPLYRGGGSPERGPGWRRLTAQIRERDGYCCRRCGKPEAEDGGKLHVDHLIPWRCFTDKTFANAPENLASLCRRCHGVKTTRAERLWLRGDVQEYEKFLRSVRMPSQVGSA